MARNVTPFYFFLEDRVVYAVFVVASNGTQLLFVYNAPLCNSDWMIVQLRPGWGRTLRAPGLSDYIHDLIAMNPHLHARYAFALMCMLCRSVVPFVWHILLTI